MNTGHIDFWKETIRIESKLFAPLYPKVTFVSPRFFIKLIAWNFGSGSKVGRGRGRGRACHICACKMQQPNLHFDLTREPHFRPFSQHFLFHPSKQFSRSSRKLHFYHSVLFSFQLLELVRKPAVKLLHGGRIIFKHFLLISQSNDFKLNHLTVAENMPSIEEEAKEERRISYLLWKAIDSQLELEKATEKLMKDIYEELEIMKAIGCSGKDWTEICDMAQQLVNTLEMLRDDEEPIPAVNTDSVEMKLEETVETVEDAEEEIEAYLEGIIKEMHPNLDQIRTEAGLKEQNQPDLFGLAKQMAKPQMFATDEETEDATLELNGDNNVGKNKMGASYHAPKNRRNQTPSSGSLHQGINGKDMSKMTAKRFASFE